jgi:hypothetical protein
VCGTTPPGFRREGKMLVRDPAEQKIVCSGAPAVRTWCQLHTDCSTSDSYRVNS